MMVTLLLAVSALLGQLPAADPDEFDFHPLPGDVALPMPNGARMVFRPVFLGIGSDPLAVREFVMGDRTGTNFREKPAAVRLGGSFLQSRDGRQDWFYYIGKYEVTEAQFQTLTTKTEKAHAQLPQVSLTRLEVEKFIQDYNAWLYREAPDALPKLDKSPGFLRLPTEEEWEFAARGGVAIAATRFEQRVPYEGDLVNFEWFSGPRSSHDKLKPVGLLAANPLGIYDMLGNAAEMTSSLYQIEQGGGRVGGYTIRGGHFRTAWSEMRASLRAEQPFFGRDRQPPRDETIGFRLVISAQVITDENSSLLESVARMRMMRSATAISSEHLSAERLRTLVQLAREHREGGRPNEALTLLERALAFDPENAEAFAETALTFEKLNQFDKAYAVWLRIADLGRKTGAYHALATLKLQQVAKSAETGRSDQGASLIQEDFKLQRERAIQSQPESATSPLPAHPFAPAPGSEARSVLSLDSRTQVLPADASIAITPNWTGERYSETRLRLLTESEIASWSLDQLQYAINEIYARHGMDFGKEELNRQFAKFPWYQIRRGMVGDSIAGEFSANEAANEKLLARFRDQKTKREAPNILPGVISLSQEHTPKVPYPNGQPVGGRPGFVVSPYAPYSGYIDVRGLPSGTQFKCPYTGAVFLVP